MMNALVSVCIPTYYSNKFITDTLDSIVRQTYDPIEIIVVDDCSTDSTWETLNRYKESYEHNWKASDKTIKLYRNDKNLGVSANWDKTIRLGTGKYAKLICADDIIAAELIEKEVAILEKYPKVCCVSSDTRFIDIRGEERGRYNRYPKSGIIKGRKAVLFSLFTRDYLGAPLANMFRVETYQRIGGIDTGYRYITDYDLYSRIYLTGEVYILHEPLNFFRIRENSNTSQVMGGDKTREYIEEHGMMLEKLAGDLNLHKWQVRLSMFIRRIMCRLGAIYIKVNK